MKRLTSSISPKKQLLKKGKEPPVKKASELSEVALAAVVSYKKQKEVTDFINFLLPALERNADWLNEIVGKQTDFKCAFLVGAGPNRFQLQEIIYPSGDNDIKLELEMKDSDDHDKIAIAALLKLSNLELENLIKYIKTRMMNNDFLREDLLKGKAMGINFVVLRPMFDKQYRVMERIVIGGSLKCNTAKKRLRDDRIFTGPPIKKTRKVA